MKIRGLSYIILALGIMLTGCEEDNFDPPKSMLTGRVVYQDQAVGVRSAAVSGDQANQTNGVQLEIWQPGYNFMQKIPVFVNQDGTFSAALFDGNYKLTRLRGSGPWADRTDTINVQVKGSTVVDVPVDPYFIVRNATIQRSGSTVNATFNLQQVVANSQLERVNLYIGTTTIVDVNNSAANVALAASDITDLSQPVSLDLNLPANLASREYIFARVGVKTVGVAEMLYSQVQKIQVR